MHETVSEVFTIHINNVQFLTYTCPSVPVSNSQFIHQYSLIYS